MEDARAFIDESLRQVRRALASPHARKIRHQVANGLIMALPLAAALPPIKRTRLGKLLEMAGGTALVVRAAEMIRDWEPSEVA